MIRRARRCKSRRDLTRAFKLIARADLALRSNAPSKRLVLENLVIQLCEEPKVVPAEWQQEECFRRSLEQGKDPCIAEISGPRISRIIISPEQ